MLLKKTYFNFKKKYIPNYKNNYPQAFIIRSVLFIPDPLFRNENEQLLLVFSIRMQCILFFFVITSSTSLKFVYFFCFEIGSLFLDIFLVGNLYKERACSLFSINFIEDYGTRFACLLYRLTFSSIRFESFNYF